MGYDEPFIGLAKGLAKGSMGGDATRVLESLAAGDSGAAERLLPLVHDELRALAANYFRDQPKDHTLQPTALVHEAFLRLVDQRQGLKDRAHFFSVAALAMRQILTDCARRRQADKRGGGWQKVSLQADDTPIPAGDEVDLEKLDAALFRLEALDGRKHRVIMLRFFSGMSVDDVAMVMGISRSTVEGDWRFAKAWLSKELSH